MSKIITVLGGISSGKSKFAEKIAIISGEKRIYVATSEVTDDEMKLKIQKHIDGRGDRFETIECFDKIDEIIDKTSGDVYMIDCVTNMINNIMYHSGVDFENCGNEVFEQFCIDIELYINKIIDAMKKNNAVYVVVTNEMGMSTISPYRYTRRFVQLQGEINQLFCNFSDEVYFVIAGIENKIKG